MEQFEEVRQMPYVTSAERIGIQKGIQQGLEQGREQGLQQGLRAGLKRTFGATAEPILPEIRQMTGLDEIWLDLY